MKVFANIPGAFKLLNCLKYMEPYKKEIEAARAAGDFERERQFILKATSSWGPMVMEMFGSSVNVKGIENLPDSGPVLISPSLRNSSFHSSRKKIWAIFLSMGNG